MRSGPFLEEILTLIALARDSTTWAHGAAVLFGGRRVALRAGIFRVLVVVILVMGGNSAASALVLDASIQGVFTDTSLSEVIPEAVVGDDGNVTGYALQAGDHVLLSIEISNPERDPIASIFATLIFQNERLEYLGGLFPGQILLGPGFEVFELLNNVGSGEIKSNSPSPATGEVWLQALAYDAGSFFPTTAAGPDVVQLLFRATGVPGDVYFDMTSTAGDEFLGVSAVSFGDASISAVPEPSSSLLIGLGLASLSFLGHPRRSGFFE